MDGHPIRGLISVLFLLCLNALVAAAEEAFSNVNGGSVEHRAQEGERRAVRLKKLLDTPHYRDHSDIDEPACRDALCIQHLRVDQTPDFARGFSGGGDLGDSPGSGDGLCDSIFNLPDGAF